jgi:hypothetical protein
MPRASMASKDAVDVSFGIQEGVVEIVKAITKVHQFPPNKQSGEQGDPFPCVQLTVVRCDNDGKRTSDDEITEELGVGKIEKFHPGKAAGPDDDDPEDLGDEVDTEGNCIFVANEGDHFAKTCKWIRFASSLEDKGFKPEVLGHGYMPDLVGMVVKVKTDTLPRTPGYTGKKDPTALVADKILVFPYDKKKGGKTNSAPAKSTSGASKSGPAPAGKKDAGTTTNPYQGDDAEAIAIHALGEMVVEYAGQEGIERKKLQTGVQTRLMRNKVPVKQHPVILGMVKDDEWLRKVTAEDEDSKIFGKISVDFDESTAMFAAAE